MSRRVVVSLAVVGLLAALAAWFATRASTRIAYHQWHMDSAHNTLFGNPEPVGNGLASYDVTGIDVDSVMANYEFHRQRLVELNAFVHLKANFPALVSDGTQQQSDARRDFVQRMWNQFPVHKHYYLANDGSFQTWVPVGAQNDWNVFFQQESARSGPAIEGDEDANKPEGGKLEKTPDSQTLSI